MCPRVGTAACRQSQFKLEPKAGLDGTKYFIAFVSAIFQILKQRQFLFVVEIGRRRGRSAAGDAWRAELRRAPLDGLDAAGLVERGPGFRRDRLRVDRFLDGLDDFSLEGVRALALLNSGVWTCWTGWTTSLREKKR